MSRKAQGLPLNTVILAILVVLVLLVVGAFFLGGTSGISKTIRSIFYGSTAGQAEVFAVQTCQQRCDSLKLLPTSSVQSSAYCGQSFFIDSDNDGEAQFEGTGSTKKYVPYYCWIGKTPQPGEPNPRSLNVPCPLSNGQQPEDYCVNGYRQPTTP